MVISSKQEVLRREPEHGTDKVLSTRARGLTEVAALAGAQLDRFGITRVSDVTGLDVVGIPVWHTVRPGAAPGLNTVTSGKGQTAEACRISAIMEAIERSCGEPAGRPTVIHSYAEMKLERHTLDPLRLIPRRNHAWTPSTLMTWWPTRALRYDTEVWVPAVTIFTPFPPEANLIGSNTAGLASGNNRDEALLHGLYEIIENDCQAFAEVLNIGYRILPETLPDAARELLERFERASVEVTVHACVNGIGIPSFFAMTEDKYAGDAMLFNGGCGCHLDPSIGVLRAITEAAQSRVGVIAGAREDVNRQEHRRAASYGDLRDKLHRWSEGRPWRSFGDFPVQTTGTINGDLSVALAALSADGLDLVLDTDLAPADLPFSVVQVVVPGAEFAHVDTGRVGPRLRRAQKAIDGPRAGGQS